MALGKFQKRQWENYCYHLSPNDTFALCGRNITQYDYIGMIDISNERGQHFEIAGGMPLVFPLCELCGRKLNTLRRQK